MKNTLRAAALGTILAVLLSISVPPVIGVPEYTRLNSPDSDLAVQERDPAIGEDFIVWTSRAAFVQERIQLRHIKSGRQEALSDIPGVQLKPIAVGREVFWIQKDENDDGAFHVMRKVLATGDETRLSNTPINSELPLVASEWGWLAWTPVAGNKIVVGNINGDDLLEIAPSEGSRIHEYAVAQDLLVWIERGDEEHLVMSQELPGGNPIVTHRSDRQIRGVATNGRKIAWIDEADGSSSLTLQDRSAKSDASPDQETIEIFGGSAVSVALTSERIHWSANVGEEWEVWSSDIGTTDGSTAISIHKGTEPIHGLTVRRDLIGWSELRSSDSEDGPPDSDIIVVKLMRDAVSQPTVVSTELPTIASHISPATDGDWVVWIDNRYGHFGVFGRELSEDEEITVDSDSGADPEHPAVDWPIVAWADKGREKPVIRIKDIESDEKISLPQIGLTDGLQLSESYMLWSQATPSTGQLLYSQRESPGIRGFSQPRTIVDESRSVRFDHHLNKDTAVWTETGASPDVDGFQIRAMDLSTGISIDVANISLFGGNPTATSTGIFWEESTPPQTRTTTKLRRWAEEGFGLDPEETVITARSTEIAGASGDSLVYIDHLSEPYTIKALNTTTKLETALVDSEQRMTNPTVKGGFIIWQGLDEGGSNIYASSLEGKDIPRTQITSGGTRLEPILFPDPTAPQRTGPGCSLF